MKGLKENALIARKEQRTNSLNNLAVSEGAITSNISKAMRTLQYDHPLSRAQLIDVAKHMGLHLSYLQATEIALYYRGKKMEDSKEFDVDKLHKWFFENIKLLRSIEKYLRNGKLR